MEDEQRFGQIEEREIAAREGEEDEVDAHDEVGVPEVQAEGVQVLVAEVEEVAEVGLEIRSGSAYITLPTILENKLLAITE